MSKNVLIFAGIAVGALLFSNRSEIVGAQQRQSVGQNFLQGIDVRTSRYELIGMGPDQGDLHTQGTSIFVLDHDSGSVIKHSFGSGTQPALHVVSTVKRP